MKRILKRIKKKIVSRAKKIYTAYFYIFSVRRLYRRAAKQPVVPNKVVFLRNREATIGDNFKLIERRLRDSARYEIHILGLGAGTRRYKNQIKFAKKAALEVATAAYVFTDDGNKLMGALPLRAETMLVNTWHACGAFKCFGTFNIGKKFGGNRMWFKMYHPYKYIDLLTVSSPEVVWAYDKALGPRLHPDCVQPLGVSRTDVFFDELYLERARKAVNRVVPQTIGKKVILYAPTYRGRVASARAPEELDIAAFKQAFEDDYVLLIKHHPFVKKLPPIPEEYADFAFDVSHDMEINQLLSVADICITDYSSVVFEYSLFERPLLFFAYDYEDYDDWRGFFYNYEEMTPGPVCRDNQSMIDYIQGLPESFDKAEISAFREKFMSSCDGHATDRIMKAVFGDKLNAIVTIIIPAYNAMPEISRALESIKTQISKRDDIRVIIVDDGSTDGTGAEADRYASAMPHLFKAIHLEGSSGTPAKPRNVGIGEAASRYVFFHDADDYLGDEAIEKMVTRLLRWNPDVLLVKFKGEDGRSVPTSMFKKSVNDIDVFESNVTRTFSPLKAIRLSFIEDHGMRFPEDCMPEDIPFTLQAYTYASKVSVASDYDYYHVAVRDDGNHATLSTWNDIDSNLKAFEGILEFVDQNIDPSVRDITLMPRLFNRDAKNMLVSAVTNHQGAERSSYLKAIIDMFSPFWTEDTGASISPEHRMILESAFGKGGGIEATDIFIREGERPLEACRFKVNNEGCVTCSYDNGNVHLSADVTGNIPMRVIPRGVKAHEHSVTFSGDVLVLEQIVRDLPDKIDISIVVKDGDGTSEFSVAARFDIPEASLETTDGSAKQEFARDWEGRAIPWEADLPFELFATLVSKPIDPEEFRKAILCLRVHIGAYSRDYRIGGRASDKVRDEFLASQFEIDGICWQPYSTRLGNFSWQLIEKEV